MNTKSSTSWFRLYKLLLFACLLFNILPANSQITVVAGPQYERSSFHQLLWGKHYRKEWITPVSVPGFRLDTVNGGLKPYQAGGGRQSKSLRLQNPDGKEYVIRSIDKSFGGALPPIYQNTFIESIMNDQVTLGHPYSAVTIPSMAEAAKIYHTNPRIVFIAEQPALDSFNKEYGNRLYLFEQRPDENWEESANFGNSNKIVSTEKMLEKIMEDNDNRADQVFYVRSRLFDFLIGDASRHEDQWRWTSFKDGDKTIYKAIPRDRDQAYAKFDGMLIKMVLSMANLGHLQTFDHKIKNVALNNFPARNLDRQIANEPTLEQWVTQANELQQLLTDEVIEIALKQLPPEVFPISGNDIIAKLKSRRNDLHLYASQYYLFLAREVEVVGSKKKELFQVTRHSDGTTSVTVSRIKKNGETEAQPFYSRLFMPNETKEIRLYGLAGNDVYEIDGESAKSIKVRILKDSADYKYDGFKYNDKGFTATVFYSHEDKLYVGLGYKILRNGWRKEPFKSKQVIMANYSIMQKAFSFNYRGAFMQIIGKWNMNIEATYDLMRWTNYYGLGNETKETIPTRNYYQLESKELLATITLIRPLGKHAHFDIGPVYNMVQVIENRERFIFHSMPENPKRYEQDYFAGGRASFTLVCLDDMVVPTKGIAFKTGAQYLKNLEKTDKQVMRYQANMQVYLPLLKNLVLAIRPAAAAVTGEPEFYQHVSIGGSSSLRGYNRDRFWGTASFYSANELQWLFNMKTHLFNGKAGLVGFYDVGRVWQKNETSNTWHTGYGGGIMIAPFNKFMASFIYGTSTEGSQLHIRVSKAL